MAQLFISERRLGDSTVLDLSGDVIFGESNTKLRSAVRALLSEGRKRITINLNEVLYVDSSGIGEFISTLIAIGRETEGELRIINPSERVLHLFEISKLIDIFQIEYEKTPFERSGLRDAALEGLGERQIQGSAETLERQRLDWRTKLSKGIRFIF